MRLGAKIGIGADIFVGALAIFLAIGYIQSDGYVC
jgi:hypothetical protein